MRRLPSRDFCSCCGAPTSGSGGVPGGGNCTCVTDPPDHIVCKDGGPGVNSLSATIAGVTNPGGCAPCTTELNKTHTLDRFGEFTDSNFVWCQCGFEWSSPGGEFNSCLGAGFGETYYQIMAIFIYRFVRAQTTVWSQVNIIQVSSNLIIFGATWASIFDGRVDCTNATFNLPFQFQVGGANNPCDFTNSTFQLDT